MFIRQVRMKVHEWKNSGASIAALDYNKAQNFKEIETNMQFLRRWKIFLAKIIILIIDRSTGEGASSCLLTPSTSSLHPSTFVIIYLSLTRISSLYWGHDLDVPEVVSYAYSQNRTIPIEWIVSLQGY